MSESDSFVRLAVSRLLAEVETARANGDLRLIAEDEFAMALLLRKVGDFESASVHARASLDAAERLPSATLDDVASRRQTVEGVPLPDYFHDGVVRARLADLLV